MARYRDISIDTLRGLAILTMIAANIASYVLAEPHPFWCRLYGSFAAPLFILLAGMMVALTTQTKGHRLKYFLGRGMLIVTVGALIDVFIWKIYPFMTVDVLYLIGISLPLAYLFLHLNTWFQWVVIISIFFLTPVLQNILGYTDYPTEFYLWGEPTTIVEDQTNILNHWIVDGRFPIFPWIGFSLLGVNLANLCLKKSCGIFKKNIVFLIGIGILGFGGIIWWLFPGRLLTREGYSELFYPPTIGYIMSAIGLILILFYIVDKWPSLIIYKPLQALGESALFMYILHLVLIEYIIAPIWSKENIQTSLLIYITLLFFLVLIAYGLRGLKIKWSNRPFIIRFLFGG